MDIITKIEQFLIQSPPKEETEYDKVVLAKQNELLKWGKIYLYRNPTLVLTPDEAKALVKTEWGEFMEEEINTSDYPHHNRDFMGWFVHEIQGTFTPGWFGNIPFRRSVLICA